MTKFDKEIFDKVKKGDSIKVTFDSGINKGSEKKLTVKSKNLVGKGKSYESEKITFLKAENPNGVKYYAYKRKDGSVGFAIGDMAISNVQIADKYAKGGGVEKNSNYKKFGKDNLRLVNFDIDDLDSYELMLYDKYTNSMDKADALQMLINTVESDYSQLNEQLAEIAEEQYPSDEFFEDNRQYKKGGGVESENKEMVLNNNNQIAHHTKELQSALKGKNVPLTCVLQ